MRLLLVLLLLLATAGPAAAAPPGQVDVAFLQGEQVVTVTRPGTTADAAVRALIAGPTAAEKREKITSTVPRKTALRGVSVAGGVATVDLGRRFASGRKAEVLAARVAQLVLTATAVPGVESVQLLIDGGTPLGLFPGYATKFPITAADVRDEDVPAPEEPPAPAEKDPSAPVRALQDRLADLGFLPRSGVDGQAGEQTRFAVMAFQKWARLDRDGIAGPRTRAALEKAKRPTPRTHGLRPPRRGPARPPARALHLRRPRRPHAARLHGRARLRHARRPLQRLPQGAQLVVGALPGLAAVGELLRRRRRLPRVARRAGRPGLPRLRARPALRRPVALRPAAERHRR